jgi:hypothetical protein
MFVFVHHSFAVDAARCDYVHHVDGDFEIYNLKLTFQEIQ